MTYLPIDRVQPYAVRADKVRGVHLAIVVENKEGDGNPGYRVKVKYPHLNDEEKTYWARIAVPMAGPQRGTYVLPEVDDQLLVVFEHGDIERPIVIGAVWNKKQEPVENNDSGKNNAKLIKSRAGHRVIFDDKDGAEKITIVDSTKQNKIVLDTANKLVKIESAGDIEIKAADNVIVHGNALKVGIKANMKASGQQMLAHGTSTLGMKAGSAITLKASQITANVSNGAACQVSGSSAGELGGIAAEQAQDQVKPQSSSAGAGGGGGGGAGGGGAGGGGGDGGGGAGGGGGGGLGDLLGDLVVPSLGGVVEALFEGGRPTPGGGDGAGPSSGASGSSESSTFTRGRTSDDVGKGSGEDSHFEQARTEDDVGLGAGDSAASENARGGVGAGAGDSAASENARGGVGAGAGDSAASENARGGVGAGAGDSAASENARGGVGAGAGDSAASENARGGVGAGAGESGASENARGGVGAGAGESGASENARGGVGAGAGESSAPQGARGGVGAGAGEDTSTPSGGRMPPSAVGAPGGGGGGAGGSVGGAPTEGGGGAGAVQDHRGAGVSAVGAGGAPTGGAPTGGTPASASAVSSVHGVDAGGATSDGEAGPATGGAHPSASALSNVHGTAGVDAGAATGGTSAVGGSPLEGAATGGVPSVSGAANVDGAAGIAGGAEPSGGAVTGGLHGAANVGNTAGVDATGGSITGGSPGGAVMGHASGMASFGNSTGVDAAGGGSGAIGGAVTGDVSSMSNVGNTGGIDATVEGTASQGSDFGAQGVMRQPEDVAGRVAFEQSSFTTSATAEAEVSQAAGVEGTTAMHGGATGVIEQRVGDPNVEGQVRYAAHIEQVGGRDAAADLKDAAVSRSGYVDPTTEAARSEQLGFNTSDNAMGRIQHAQDTADQVRTTAADPSAAAFASGRAEVTTAATGAVPASVSRGAADAHLASDAVHNPEAVANARVDLEVDQQEREQATKLGLQGSARDTRRGEPGGGDENT